MNMAEWGLQYISTPEVYNLLVPLKYQFGPFNHHGFGQGFKLLHGSICQKFNIRIRAPRIANSTAGVKHSCHPF